MVGSAVSEPDELAHEVGVFDLEPYARSLVLAELVASRADHEVNGVRHIPPRLANKLNCSHLGYPFVGYRFKVWPEYNL